MNIDNFGRRDFVPLPGGGTGGEPTAGGSSGGCCCCERVLFPTTVLSDDTETVERWSPCNQIQSVYWQHAEGEITLTFPIPSAMVLDRVDEEDYFEWTFDGTDGVVTATYEDGTDATSFLTNVVGHLRFWLSTSDAQFGGGTVTGAELEFDADLAAQIIGIEEEPP